MIVSFNHLKTINDAVFEIGVIPNGVLLRRKIKDCECIENVIHFFESEKAALEYVENYDKNLKSSWSFWNFRLS